MGANDLREMLEAAREENIRLEADNARLERENQHLTRIVAGTGVTREMLGELIWRTSRADEASISVTGANIVADAILAAGYVRTSPAAEPSTGCQHPREALYMRGWTQVCGDCGLGREL